MSGFIINPYVFAGAAPPTTIQASTMTQDDLDIDVTDCDIIEVFWNGMSWGATGGTQEDPLQYSIDNKSTWRSTAGDYREWRVEREDENEEGFLIWQPGSGTETSYGGFWMGGFASGTYGWINYSMAQTAGQFTNVNGGYGRAHNTSEITHIRLGELADFETTSGEIVVIKRSVVSKSTLTNLDFTTDTSGTDGLTFTADQYYRGHLWVEAVENTGSNNRLEYRFEDATGVDSGSIYHQCGTDATVGSGAGTQASASADNGNGKDTWGGQVIGLDQNWQVLTSPGSSVGAGNSPFGFVIDLGDACQGIYPHSYADGVSYNTGTAGLELYEYNTTDLEEVTTGSGDTYVEFNVSGYDECMIFFDWQTYYATAGDLDCALQYSTDNGSSWQTGASAYRYMQAKAGAVTGAYARLGFLSGSNGAKGFAEIHGLSAGAMLCGLGMMGDTAQRGQYFTELQTHANAITHLRLYEPAGSDWATGVTVRCLKGGH